MGKRYRTVEEVRAYHRRNLGNMETSLGQVLPVKFHASQMLAGPCKAARIAAGIRTDSRTWKVPPLDLCSHPEQCGCTFVIDEKRLFG